MTFCPDCSFFISGEERQISPDNPLWQRPLSGNSLDFFKNHLSKNVQTNPVQISPVQTNPIAQASEITIGEYLKAAENFLTRPAYGGGSNILASAFAGIAEGEGNPIHSVELFLEKHGAFYHPIRVKVLSETGQSFSFVLNGAVSRPGLALIQKEYQLLSRLEKQVSTTYTPVVFGTGSVTLENQARSESSQASQIQINQIHRKRQVRFFLGEWFEGFKEFHITRNQGNLEIAIWASSGDISYLSLDKALVIYEQIAYILTSYYNIYTGEQIFPWHHAAGDFIVNPREEGLPVKLITVRGYEILMEFDSDDSRPGVVILQSLLFFFLSLTIRMQMDRLDGIGSMVFLGKAVLEATTKGFLRALDVKAGENTGDILDKNIQPPKSLEGLGEAFTEFMAGFSQNQVLTILKNLIQSWPSSPLEQDLIKVHLESHCACVYSIFKNK